MPSGNVTIDCELHLHMYILLTTSSTRTLPEIPIMYVSRLEQSRCT